MPSSHKSRHSHSTKSNGTRTFTINRAYHVDGCPTKFSHGDYTGRYHNNTPARAAQKALSHLCRVKRIRGQCTLYIEMRETTQGSKHKIFAYKAKRIHLAKPLEIGNRTYNYSTKVASVKVIPTDKCHGPRKTSGRMISEHSKMLHSKKHHTKKSQHHTKNTTRSISRKISNSVRKTIKRVSKML